MNGFVLALGSVKDALKASLGKDDVSDIEVERFVEDSGREAVAKAMNAVTPMKAMTQKNAGTPPAVAKAIRRCMKPMKAK